MANFEYTKDQQIAYSHLNSKNNVFITGPAGTGKSSIFAEYLRDAEKIQRIPILASTGAAAVLIGGRTFHSFFGLGTMQKSRHQIVEEALDNPNIEKNMTRSSIIAIDEISMLSSETLSVAEEIARRIRGNNNVWGGFQVLASGDFLQLPPISNDNSSHDWAFQGDIWKRSDFKVCALTEVVRTDDKDFVELLHRIRRGGYDKEIYDFLKRRTISFDDLDTYTGTRLYPHKLSVNEVNLRKLAELPGEEKSFTTMFKGDEKYIKSLTRNLPIPEVLVLKVGALVMIRRNAMDLSYVNGTLGIVKEIHSDYILLEVKNLKGRVFNVALERCSYEWLSGNGTVMASARNFPLTLAWACTIHKAQGATIDNVCVDLRGVWEHGQAYVALSRVRHVDGLKIMGWDNNSIHVDSSVVSYYDELKPEICVYDNTKDDIKGVPENPFNLEEAIAKL